MRDILIGVCVCVCVCARAYVLEIKWKMGRLESGDNVHTSLNGTETCCSSSLIYPSHACMQSYHAILSSHSSRYQGNS